MERYSKKVILEKMFGEKEKSIQTSKSTKKVNKKTKDGGKYITKIVDGVKYMVLK
jgi:hypothetical protein